LPLYEYQAKDRAGKTVTGTLDAVDQKVVVRELRAQGYFPMRVRLKAVPAKSGKTFDLGLALFPVKTRDRALFFRHLAATLKAGITPARALHTCVERITDLRLRRLVRQWIPQVEAGKALSDIMRQHPQVCPTVTAEIVRAGEEGGFLDSAFAMIAEDLELQLELQQQMKWQMLYFKILLPLILLIPPLPRLISMEREPLSAYLTRYLHGLAETTLPLIVLLAVGWCLLHISRAIPLLNELVNGAKMLLPGYARFVQTAARARFFTNLAYLCKAGVPLASGLRAAAPTCGIRRMEQAIMATVPAVEGGARLTESLERSGQLSRYDVQMLATGEESGTIPEALERIAQSYQSEVRGTIKNLGNTLRLPLYLAAGAAVAYAVGTAAVSYFNRLFELGDEMMNF